MKALECTGLRFGMLMALSRVGSRKGMAVWRFACDCGEETEALVNNVRNGNTRSCGCVGRANREALRAARTTHGHATGGVSPTYRSWRNARDRACRSGNVNFARYGGAGIGMCDRWKASFSAFLADMGERPEGTTLDRVENSRGYEPGNCRWATPVAQVQNRRCARWVDHDGRRYSLKAFAGLHGVRVDAIWRRVQAGLSVELALSQAKARRR